MLTNGITGLAGFAGVLIKQITVNPIGAGLGSRLASDHIRLIRLLGSVGQFVGK